MGKELQTQLMLIDDATLAVHLARDAVARLIPAPIQKEVALAQLATKPSPWGDAYLKHGINGEKTDDGLRLGELLSAMTEIVAVLGYLAAAKSNLEASTREPNLTLGKHRRQ